jgi:hypothetical protein
MNSRLILAILFVLSGLLVSPVTAGAEPMDGAVSGRVVNATAGGASTAGESVTLVAFGRKEQGPLGQQSTTIGDDGRYAFGGLDRDPNVVYITLTRHQGVNYPAAEPFQLIDNPSHEADIQVFDSTTADDAIRLERLNLLVVGSEPGLLQVFEMGALVNTGDRTYVTPNPQDQTLARGLRFPLPNGAIATQMQAGFRDQDVVPTIGGIQVITPVLPGRHEFALSFQMPFSGSNADLTLQVPYPTAAFTVYLPATGIGLRADGLAAGSPTMMGGQSYTPFVAANVARATMMPVQVTGLGPAGGVGPNQLAAISLGVVLLVLGGGVLLFSMQRRRASASAVAAGDGVGALEDERLQLLVRMAALDERYAAGDIAEDEYGMERERGKRRLVELTLVSRQRA